MCEKECDEEGVLASLEQMALASPQLETQKHARRAPRRWPSLLMLSPLLLLIAVAPSACLSDVNIPQCVHDDTCAGSGDQESDGGDAGALARGGSAGSVASKADTSEAGATEGDSTSTSGRSGDSSSGTSGAGSSGAGSSGKNEALTSGAGSSATSTGGMIIVPGSLPEPCRRDRYSTAIGVRGGVAPYSWSVTTTTGTWAAQVIANAADSGLATLSGDPDGKAEFAVTVTDHAGHAKSTSYSVSPRRACYFANIEPSDGGPRLALRDPLLGIVATGKLLNNHAVLDFQFSPDGRLLAYRYSDNEPNASNAHLSVLDLMAMQDRPLDLQETSVTNYAWSPDSAVLAVALTASNESKLGGAKFTFSGSGVQITPLEAVLAAYPIQSNLLWVGTQLVTYFSKADLELGAPPSANVSATFYAPLLDVGFDLPLPIYDAFFKKGFGAKQAPGGLFVTSPNDQKSFYNSVTLDNPFEVDHSTNYVDPGGRYSARVKDKTLELFAATDGRHVFETSGTSQATNCPKLLSWARDRERVVCVANASEADLTWGELRIFDVGSTTPLELSPTVLKGACRKDAQGVPIGAQCSQSEYDVSEASSSAQPRLLSASGRWLAVVTGANSGAAGYLYWADLDSTPASLARKFDTSGTAANEPVALAFSPSERFLLRQNGSALWAHYLPAGANDAGDFALTKNGLSADVTAPCVDDYIGGPSRWCGGANDNAAYTWSPDSEFDVLAYRKSDQLIVVELSHNGFIAHELAAPACDATCTGQYAFQPPSP